MILNGIFGGLAVLSFALTVWQWLVARKFPLHRRMLTNSTTYAVTLLKPLKGCDEHTEKCLRSWFAQEYPGEVQVLLAVDDESDPVAAIATKLMGEFPQRDAQLVACPERLGANAKVSKLAQLEPLAKHEVIVISDADVLAPPDLLANVVPQLEATSAGVVCCFYQLAHPATLAMRWEAVAVNVDFWSQVLQSQSLKPLDFALGAVMTTCRKDLTKIDGFRALVDCLADDYQLGQRIAKRGRRIELSPVVVECWSPAMGWREAWRHQLRWARTIRVCEPLPYFFSILSNASLWPLLWLILLAVRSEGFFCEEVESSSAVNAWTMASAVAVMVFLVSRWVIAARLHLRFAQKGIGFATPLLVMLKDFFQAAIWVSAFTGNRVYWRGESYRLRRDGTLKRL